MYKSMQFYIVTNRLQIIKYKDLFFIKSVCTLFLVVLFVNESTFSHKLNNENQFKNKYAFTCFYISLSMQKCVSYFLPI